MLQCDGARWRSIARIKLPKSVRFEDYSAVSLRGRRLAVVSQQSSQLWIGTLRFSDWSIEDEGTIYDFPRTRKGKIKYRTVEGLAWLSDHSFVCVSDYSKRRPRKRDQKKDQSIHIVELPKRAASGQAARRPAAQAASRRKPRAAPRSGRRS